MNRRIDRRFDRLTKKETATAESTQETRVQWKLCSTRSHSLSPEKTPAKRTHWPAVLCKWKRRSAGLVELPHGFRLFKRKYHEFRGHGAALPSPAILQRHSHSIQSFSTKFSIVSRLQAYPSLNMKRSENASRPKFAGAKTTLSRRILRSELVT